jgi:hypothetical protein
MVESVETPAVVAAPEAPVSHSSDNPKIVSEIQAHLDAFTESLETSDTPAAPKTPAESVVPAAEEKPVEVPTEEKPVETPAEEAVAAPVASTLPAAYVRTAKARGWTDQEVTDFAAANPDLALKTFERMHESRTKEINEWAELGRKVRQTPSASPTAPSPMPTPAATVVPPATLQPVDVAALVEKFGNEELIQAIAGPVNSAIEALRPIMSEMSAAKEQTRQAQHDALTKTVQDFFTDKALAPFTEAYGKDISALTKPQIEARQRVLETADALIAGAAYQGRSLSVQDALTLAHDSVSSNLKETVIRDQIRSNLKKRNAGISLRPTAQGRPAVGGPPRDRAELLGRTEDRLASVFG